MAKQDTLDEVTVDGVRHNADYRSTTATYTVKTSSLAQLGVTDISSAINKLAGITLRDYGGAGGLKTVSVRGLGSQHTAVVYDGVALSDCQTGSIDVSKYSLNNVDYLQLVVGENDDILQPARNSASAASLRINTCKMPSNDRATHINTSIEFGSWTYICPYFKIEKNLSSRFGLSAAGTYTHADNNYPYTIKNVRESASDTRKNSAMNSGNAEVNFMFEPSKMSHFALKIYFYDNSRKLPGMVHYYVNDSKETLHDENIMSQLNYKQEIGNKLQLLCIAKFNWQLTDYKDPSYANNIMDHKYWQREAYTSACLMYSASKHLSTSYAADYAYNNLSGSDEAEYRNPLRHSVLKRLSAKYSNGRFTILGNLLHSLYLNDASSGASAKDLRHLSPSVSFNYRLLYNEALYIRVYYKDIFRAPSFNELYYKHYGSTSLNPEKTKQIAAGLTWNHNYGKASYFTLTVDGYYNNVTDKIIAVPYNMFIWTNINMGKVKAVGIDATANASHDINSQHKIVFQANYTLQKVRNNTSGDAYYGKQIAYTPEHTGSFSVAWENKLVNISANGFMVTSRWANNEHYQGTMLDGYANYGITLYRSFGISNGKLDARLDVKNIFNKQYEIVRFYPMPGRSWLATVKYHI